MNDLCASVYWFHRQTNVINSTKINYKHRRKAGKENLEEIKKKQIQGNATIHASIRKKLLDSYVRLRDKKFNRILHWPRQACVICVCEVDTIYKLEKNKVRTIWDYYFQNCGVFLEPKVILYALIHILLCCYTYNFSYHCSYKRDVNDISITNKSNDDINMRRSH